MQKYLFKNIQVVNEGKIQSLDVLTNGDRIEKIAPAIDTPSRVTEINGEGKYLFPGVIDDQVHFREPGLTHKASIYTESRAAVAGGVTSFMEMPNTIPNALTPELLEAKYDIGAQTSLANYSFFMGTSNTNAEEVLKMNKRKKDVCGVKIFMGASTGNMLVDSHSTLDRVFRESEMLIATHCEDERIIRSNYERIKAEKGELRASDHPLVRDEEACFESSLVAIKFAQKYNSRLHILHISTEKELQLFGNMMPLAEKRITAEVCVHHLHFTADDYDRLGYKIKCNPAIKAPHNKEALWKALLDDRLDIIATDHAPHLLTEKEGPYEHAHAGLPLVQHPLLLMLYYHKEERISLEKIAEKMCHAPALCFQVANRGFIREGYFADLVVVDPDRPFTVNTENIFYKCGWSPLENFHFPASIAGTFVNGHRVYDQGSFDESVKGQRLTFNR
ncbi:MAG: dihydroorotase [Chitinophagales bacterium]|nr:dihydroorotase [Chitinophagales bacterium]